MYEKSQLLVNSNNATIQFKTKNYFGLDNLSTLGTSEQKY